MLKAAEAVVSVEIFRVKPSSLDSNAEIVGRIGSPKKYVGPRLSPITNQGNACISKKFLAEAEFLVRFFSQLLGDVCSPLRLVSRLLFPPKDNLGASTTSIPLLLLGLRVRRSNAGLANRASSLSACADWLPPRARE